MSETLVACSPLAEDGVIRALDVDNGEDDLGSISEREASRSFSNSEEVIS